jgi:hypothetical protein
MLSTPGCFVLLFNMSQHLVRKLMKATSTEAQDVAVVQQGDIATKKSQRKRKQPSGTDADIEVSEESMVAWHTKLLLATDRTMASSSASKSSSKSLSNAAAVGKLRRRREQKMKSIEAARAAPKPLGAARTTASRQPQLVNIPTYNKVRHEKERQEKKRMKLAKALEKLYSTKKSIGRKQKTIFG